MLQLDVLLNTEAWDRQSVPVTCRGERYVQLTDEKARKVMVWTPSELRGLSKTDWFESTVLKYWQLQQQHPKDAAAMTQTCRPPLKGPASLWSLTGPLWLSVCFGRNSNPGIRMRSHRNKMKEVEDEQTQEWVEQCPADWELQASQVVFVIHNNEDLRHRGTRNEFEVVCPLRVAVWQDFLISTPLLSPLLLFSHSCSAPLISQPSHLARQHTSLCSAQKCLYLCMSVVWTCVQPEKLEIKLASWQHWGSWA